MLTSRNRKAAQKELTYQVVFEESPEPKFLIDCKGNILDANNAFAAILGLKPEDCIGKDVFQFSGGDVTENRRKQVEKAFKTGQRIIFEDCSSGRYFRNMLYPVIGENGKCDMLYVFAQDITAATVAEKNTKKHFSFSKEAMEAFLGPYVVLDPKPTIISFNSNFRKLITGNESDDLSSYDPFQLFFPEDKTFVVEKLQTVLLKGSDVTADIRVLIQGGPEYKWFRITVKRIIVDDEIFLVCSGTDIDEYKKAEQDLSMSNELLRFILAQSKTGSWEWNLRTGSSKWSDEVWQLYGIDKNACEPSYENWLKLILEEDRESIKRQSSEALKNNAPFTLEVRTRHCDGSLHWLMIRAIPFKDAFGNISRYVGSVVDITDLKEARQSSNKAEALNKTIIDSIPGPFYIIDENGNYAGWNAFDREVIAGKTDSEMSAIRVIDTVHPEDRALVGETIAETMKTGVDANVDGRILLRGGPEFRWFSCSARRVIIDGHPFLVGIGTDTTERKESEQRLKESEERFRKFFEMHTAAMLLVDLENNDILDANSSAVQFYGWKHEQLCRMHIKDINAFPSEIFEKIHKEWNKSDNRHFESLHKKADGSVRNVEVFAQKVFINGKFIIYAIIHDITERKRAEETLKKLSVAIEQSPAIVVITDPEGNIEYANPMFTASTGYTLEEAKGRNPRILKSGMMSREFYENLWKTILSGKVWNGEFHNKKKNGELYWENAVISAIRNDAGNVTNFVAVKEDITEKKKLWDELFENKAILDAALESMTDAVIISDPKGRFIEFNTAFATFHRFRDKNEYLTTLTDYPAIFELCKPDGTPVTFEQWPLPRALRGETAVAFECVLKRKDTGEKWIGSYNFGPIRDSEGNITGSVITARDVTHIKKAEEALRESEERFRKFFEQHSAIMIVLDPETGNIVDVNNAAVDFYGWRREQLIRMNVINLSTDKPETSRKRLDVWKTTSTRVFTVTHRIADGSLHDIEVYGQKIQVQNRWLSFLILQDITEQKRVQQALVESNERVHYILNAANAGIWESDLTTNQNYWSDELWLLYDAEPNSFPLTFDYMANSVLPEDRQTYEKAIADAVNNASELNANWRIKDSTGNIRWLLCKGNPVKDSNGNVLKYVGIVLDISRQKMMEEENRQLESRIQKTKRLETIGTLAGGIAHDFNNILTPIMGFAEMGTMKLTEDDPLQDYFREIMIAAERAQNLVSQILTFGKEKVSEPVVVCVQSIVEEALKLLHPAIPANIRIEQQIDPSCRNILADPSKIHQVIVNICTNAYHAMEKTGGTLSIKLDEVNPDTNLLKRLPELHDQPYARLTISDTGCGMDKMTMDHIFEPFFTTKPVNKGTGLGLSVVHGIITGYKGVIDVVSEPGKGSSFHIYLPLVDQKITCMHRQDVVLKENGTILFIDDEETTLKIVTIMLTELGHRVRALNSPHKAIELFRQSPDDFDLVITDLTMPEMTGFEVASEIHECRPDMPVILMTGYGKDMDNFDELKKHGIRQVLKKPVKVETLVIAINTVLHLHQ
ncbi:MAG: PAS domain S-box protein [Chlorobiaceae bacterium]|nr:PAS domain S-box protein [Chlorobiaceae bacterium]